MKIAMWLVLLVAWSFAYCAPTTTSGQVRCSESTAEVQSKCYAEWTWVAQPKAYQWIQTLTEDGVWNNIAEVPPSASGKSVDAVEPGKLFRVHSCAESESRTDCIDSTVAWSPMYPKESAIPALIVSDRGQVFGISKRTDYVTQLMQLNHYAIGEMFGRIKDPTKLPQMTPPLRQFGDKGLTYWDNVANEIYSTYQALRLPQSEESSTVNKGPPQFIGDVPIAERAKWTAFMIHDGANTSQILTFEPAHPRYTVTIFSDVTCQHCRQTAKEMNEITKLGIRVRIIPFPIAGPDSPAANTMSAILCSANRNAAWMAAAENHSLQNGPCDSRFSTAVTMHYALGKKLGIPGSPATFSDDGQFLGGYLTPTQMVAKLESLSASN